MTQLSLRRAFLQNFLGNAPPWYKNTIIGFLLLNPIIHAASPYLAGWLLLCQFLFTLVMSLRCYPLQPGGLLAIEAVAIGMTSPLAVYREVVRGFDVILLLIFMVAGISFLKELLLYMVTKLVISIRSKQLLMMSFTTLTVALSAFLDALTGIAIIITVAMGFYRVYHRVASGRHLAQADAEGASEPDLPAGHPAAAAAAEDGEQVQSILRATRFEWDLVQLEDLEQFRAFLRSLVMHGAVATALGGVMTLVGEPQNLLIGRVMGWDFATFFTRMAPVALPVAIAGVATCILLERVRWFGYGERLPPSVRAVMERYDEIETAAIDARKRARLLVQGTAAVFLIAALAFHLAEVGLIGLTVIVFTTAFNGVIEEKRIGQAFEEALPFAALLVAFFAIVALIHEQHLFAPIVTRVLASQDRAQLVWMFAANGLLSTISDNVFVATVYISEIESAFELGQLSREQFDLLAIAVNTGTNIPSVATPNGQAAFLFLLTSTLSPLIRLGYLRMIWMALPYTIVMSATGLLAVLYLL